MAGNAMEAQQCHGLRHLTENCVIIKRRIARNAIPEAAMMGFADGKIDKQVR